MKHWTAELKKLRKFHEDEAEHWGLEENEGDGDGNSDGGSDGESEGGNEEEEEEVTDGEIVSGWGEGEKKGGGRGVVALFFSCSCLALRPFTTHPFLDGTLFLLLIETSPTFQRSMFLPPYIEGGGVSVVHSEGFVGRYM